MNKVMYVDKEVGGDFQIECEDPFVLERLTMLLSPYSESSIETELVSQPPVENNYLEVSICGIIFHWPHWLKAKYIAMGESGDWYGFITVPKQFASYWSWESPDDAYVPLQTTLFDLKFPDISSPLWKETLTKNPWNGQEESST